MYSSGRNSIWAASWPASYTGSASTNEYELYADAIGRRCSEESKNPRSSTRPGRTTSSVDIGR